MGDAARTLAGKKSVAQIVGMQTSQVRPLARRCRTASCSFEQIKVTPRLTLEAWPGQGQMANLSAEKKELRTNATLTHTITVTSPFLNRV